jgi:glycosyltransferase involved in cell wall biosynthesis
MNRANTIRVAMVASQAPPVYGGAGTQAIALARTLWRDHGITVDLITQNQLRAPRRELVADGVWVFRSGGERFARFAPSRLAEMLRTVFFCAFVFLRLVRGRYDVIHLHGSYWFGLPAAILARWARKPLVVKVTRLGEDDPRTVTGKRLGPLPIGRLYGAAFSAASMTIALSREIAERHQATLPGKPVMLIPNGVDVDAFQAGRVRRDRARAKLGVANDTFLVLFVGYLVAHKGLGTLLDAWDELGRDGERELLLVGPASGFYREIADIPARASRTPGVEMLNHVDASEMPEIYAAADAFALPTRAEGMPNSLLEALASGLPAVVSEVPGVIEISEKADGVVALPTVSARTITDALTNLERHWREGLRDRQPRLPSSFSLSAVASRYADLYRRLVEDERRAGWLR